MMFFLARCIPEWIRHDKKVQQPALLLAAIFAIRLVYMATARYWPSLRPLPLPETSPGPLTSILCSETALASTAQWRLTTIRPLKKFLWLGYPSVCAVHHDWCRTQHDDSSSRRGEHEPGTLLFHNSRVEDATSNPALPNRVLEPIKITGGDLDVTHPLCSWIPPNTPLSENPQYLRTASAPDHCNPEMFRCRERLRQALLEGDALVNSHGHLESGFWLGTFTAGGDLGTPDDLDFDSEVALAFDFTAVGEACTVSSFEGASFSPRTSEGRGLAELWPSRTLSNAESDEEAKRLVPKISYDTFYKQSAGSYREAYIAFAKRERVCTCWMNGGPWLCNDYSRKHVNLHRSFVNASDGSADGDGAKGGHYWHTTADRSSDAYPEAWNGDLGYKNLIGEKTTPEARKRRTSSASDPAVKANDGSRNEETHFPVLGEQIKPGAEHGLSRSTSVINEDTVVRAGESKAADYLVFGYIAVGLTHPSAVFGPSFWVPPVSGGKNIGRVDFVDFAANPKSQDLYQSHPWWGDMTVAWCIHMSPGSLGNRLELSEFVFYLAEKVEEGRFVRPHLNTLLGDAPCAAVNAWLHLRHVCAALTGGMLTVRGDVAAEKAALASYRPQRYFAVSTKAEEKRLLTSSTTSAVSGSRYLDSTSGGTRRAAPEVSPFYLTNNTGVPVQKLQKTREHCSNLLQTACAESQKLYAQRATSASYVGNTFMNRQARLESSLFFLHAHCATDDSPAMDAPFDVPGYPLPPDNSDPASAASGTFATPSPDKRIWIRPGMSDRQWARVRGWIDNAREKEATLRVHWQHDKSSDSAAAAEHPEERLGVPRYGSTWYSSAPSSAFDRWKCAYCQSVMDGEYASNPSRWQEWGPECRDCRQSFGWMHKDAPG
ncbi:unnamed protein product [Amoebophrya sp. A25]|nr:unnamed protein product [Amoebophrya sp. A25]|eukprot:GSA25T00016234001.1